MLCCVDTCVTVKLRENNIVSNLAALQRQVVVTQCLLLPADSDSSLGSKIDNFRQSVSVAEKGTSYGWGS